MTRSHIDYVIYTVQSEHSLGPLALLVSAISAVMHVFKFKSFSQLPKTLVNLNWYFKNTFIKIDATEWQDLKCSPMDSKDSEINKGDFEYFQVCAGTKGKNQQQKFKYHVIRQSVIN